MSIIFFLTEGMLRHMKINVSFGPSSGTDMSNFRPWLMDCISITTLTWTELHAQLRSTSIENIGLPFPKKCYIKTTKFEERRGRFHFVEVYFSSVKEPL